MLDKVLLDQANDFLVTFARVGIVLGFGLFQVFPGLPASAKAAFAAAIAFLLSQSVSGLPSLTFSLLLSELTLGLTLGWLSTLIVDWTATAAQLISLQAGFSYATALDPTSQTDSGLLPSLAKGSTMLLLLASDFDHQLLLTLLGTYKTIPAGLLADWSATGELFRLLSNLFHLSIRLALPLVVILVLADIALALLGRLHQQMQLQSVAFPLKLVLWPLAILICLPVYPKLVDVAQGQYFQTLRSLVQR
jgi:flagellar biosynthesis protein FliR